MRRVAVIGAGLSGIVLANELAQHANVTVFEKARGLGGRMSTRRAEPYTFDHGAQYFTARTKAFQEYLRPLIEKGDVAIWTPRHVGLDAASGLAKKDVVDETVRFVGVPGMNSVVKSLAKSCEARVSTRIEQLRSVPSGWELYDDAGDCLGEFGWVVTSTPPAQAAVLLPKTFRYFERCEATDIKPCFVLMLGLEQPLALDFDCASVQNSDVSWLAVNSSKPNRPERFSLLVHASKEYSIRHIDDEAEAVLMHLKNVVGSLLGHDMTAAAYQSLHRWRYAQSEPLTHREILIDSNLKLAACGDWCVEGRVEGAFTSAFELADKMKQELV